MSKMYGSQRDVREIHVTVTMQDFQAEALSNYIAGLEGKILQIVPELDLLRLALKQGLLKK